MIRVGGRSPGGLQALLGAPMAVYDGPGGKMRTEDTEGTARGPGWREFAGTFGCAVGSSVADGDVRSGVEWLASALGKMQGEAAGRARPAPPPQGLGGHHLLTQSNGPCAITCIASQAALAAKRPDGCGSAPRRT